METPCPPLGRGHPQTASMTVQSSFLIRCSLASPESPEARKSYWVQHVQTGAEFRAGSLADITQWISNQNLAYLAERLNTSGENSAPSEETR